MTDEKARPSAVPEKKRGKLDVGAAWKRLRGGATSPGRLAVSVAVGLFIGCLPLYGVQLPLVLLWCMPLRLDAAVAYFAAHISNPLTLPFLLALEAEVGSLLLTGQHTVTDLPALRELGFRVFGLQLAVGSLVVGAGAALLGGTTTFLASHGVQGRTDKARTEAHLRTLARYDSAPRPVRAYIRTKLLTDPTLADLLGVEGPLGRVVDVGSGFGQVGLGLLENGRLTSLVGIDVSAERVAIARAAARGDAEFRQGRLEDVCLPAADTYLFVDTLHYLPLEVQDAALTHAAEALPSGGRILIREVDARPTLRSRITQWLEVRAARRRGDNVTFGFRRLTDLAAKLESLGLQTAIAEPRGWSVLENGLVVGWKALAPRSPPGVST